MSLLGHSYNSGQPRDKKGMWTDGPGGSANSSSKLLGSNKSTSSTVDVSDDHQKAITSYTGGNYNAINGYLRGSKRTITDEHATTIEKLSDFLDKSPKVVATSYRGINLNEYTVDDFTAKLQKGAIFNDKGFTSTTSDKKVAEKFGTSGRVKALIAIEGKSGVSIEHLSDVKGEKEILFNKGTKMIVKDFKIKRDKKGLFTDIYVTLSEP